MKPLIIGLDLGTSSVRAVLVDMNGSIIREATCSYPLYHPHNGWAEHNGEDWLEASAQVLRSVVQGVPSGQIKAVGLTGQMNGLVCLGKDHKPLRPAILWCDQRSEKQCQSVNNRIDADKIKQITCNVPIVGLTSTKWLWVKENEPHIAERTRGILLPKDYVRLMLTGEFATDVEDGSGMQMMDVPNRCWSSEMLSALEIRQEWVGTLYESHRVTGAVTHSASMRTGLPEGIPVIAGAGDNGASAIGLGVLKEGEGFVTIGTSGVVFAPFNRPLMDAKNRMNTYCAAVPQTWHALAAVQAAGLSLRWFRDLMYPQDAEYSLINLAVENTPIGARGVTFLPYLMGERTPHMDPQCRGAFFGISASTTKEDMARAVMEGISMGLCDCLDVIRSTGVELQSLRFCGGGSKSTIWRQMLADIFGIPVSIGNGSAALGAAILAAVGGKVYEDTAAACSNMVHLTAKSDPDLRKTARYAELLQTYRMGYAAQKEISQKLSAFR